MPKDENGDVNLNYIEGELQMCYDDVTQDIMLLLKVERIIELWKNTNML